MNLAQSARSARMPKLAVQARAQFILRTYGHLLGAVLAFAALEVFFFTSGLAVPIAQGMMGLGGLVMIGGFIVVGMLGRHLAHSARSRGAQYAGLGLTILLWSVFFVPALLMAEGVAPGAIQSAGVVTVLGFGGLTAVAFTTRKDFSFLGGLLRWGFIVALVLIVASLIFGFHLGTFFSVAMVGLSGVAILYDTSNVLHHYDEDSYVAASLELFVSVAMMFWYLLRLFSSRD